MRRCVWRRYRHPYTHIRLIMINTIQASFFGVSKPETGLIPDPANLVLRFTQVRSLPMKKWCDFFLVVVRFSRKKWNHLRYEKKTWFRLLGFQINNTVTPGKIFLKVPFDWYYWWCSLKRICGFPWILKIGRFEAQRWIQRLGCIGECQISRKNCS